MIKSNFHTHTTWCDGKNSPEEMALKAIDLGFTALGFSGHSYMECEPGYCMSDSRGYINDIHNLAVKYKDYINIYCGVEQDYFSKQPTNMYDYIIGSLHYILHNNTLYSVDSGKNIFINEVETLFNGDYYSFIEKYYQVEANIIKKTNAQLIGHFDLITKYNEKNCLFDTSNPRYIRAWRTAIDILLKYNIPFEINTGAISRGYRSLPYPSEEILRYIAKNSGFCVVSADCHDCNSLNTGFDIAEYLIRTTGIKVCDFETVVKENIIKKSVN